jgi:sugar/nucleoside kinase (ribokinase family)
MTVLAVGSLAFDTIKTPHGHVEKELGGSATYFSLAASYFTEVAVVGVVGDDFGAEQEAVLSRRGVRLEGVERAPGKTFHWGGEYRENLNEAITNFTDLNVFERFAPKIPAALRDSEFLFLGNIQPSLQADVRRQMKNAHLVAGDTMNYWINSAAAELAEAIKLMDILLINDTEAKSLGHDNSLPRAANKILTQGPKALVIKHGEYGATVFFGENSFGGGRHPFRAPALPLDEVKDPTGAGDSFAGGFVGSIAAAGASGKAISRDVLKRAMFYGGVMGSFAVEDFGTRRLQSLSREEIDARFQVFRDLTHLE